MNILMVTVTLKIAVVTYYGLFYNFLPLLSVLYREERNYTTGCIKKKILFLFLDASSPGLSSRIF